MDENTEIARLCPPRRKALLNAHDVLMRVEAVLNYPYHWVMDNVLNRTADFVAAEKDYDKNVHTKLDTSKLDNLLDKLGKDANS